MLAMCSLETEYRENPTGARIYTPEQLALYGLEHEKLVCTICGTSVYLYDGKRIHHFPNMPHRSEICAYLAYHAITFDYSKIDVRKLLVKWEKIRNKGGRNLTPPTVDIEVPSETGTDEVGSDLGSDGQDVDQESQDSNGITMEELLNELLQPSNMEGEDEGGVDSSEADSDENNLLNEGGSVSPAEGNNEPKEERITWKTISKLKDFYTSGMAGFFAKKELDEDDGSSHYVYHEIITKSNAKYVFGKGLFTGGARVIEMTLDGYCDGRPIGPDYGRGPNYLVFRSYWSDGTDADGRTIWKNVRFLIRFRFDPKFYDEFKGQFMLYDANRKLYIPKNKSQVYTVSAFFKKTNGFCEGKCYRCRQHNLTYCDNCVAQFEAEIVNPKNQMYLHDIDRYVDLGDPEE